MGRNLGLNVTRLYSEEEFNDGCTFNLWMGVGIGMVFTSFLVLAFLWYHGLVL